MQGTTYKEAMRERNVMGKLVQQGHRMKFKRFRLARQPRNQTPVINPIFMQRSKWGRLGPDHASSFTLGDVIIHNNPKVVWMNPRGTKHLGYHKSFIV